MRHRTWHIVLPLCVPALLLFGGCSRTGEGPTRRAGRAPVIEWTGGRPTAIRRAVSTCSAATQALVDLDATDVLVGTDRYSRPLCPDRETALVGTGGNTSSELLLELRPDVVLCWSYQQRLLDQCRRLGLRTGAVRLDRPEQVVTLIETLGALTGRTERAATMTDGLRSELQILKARVASVPPERRPRVYIELYRPYRTVSGNTFTGRLIELAGGRNIAGDSPVRYPILSPEAIICARPEVIFLTASETDTSQLAARPGWDDLPAVRTGRVHVLSGPALTAGSRFTDTVSRMQASLFPETHEIEDQKCRSTK